MQYIKQNEPVAERRRIRFALTSAADGSRLQGVAAQVTVALAKNDAPVASPAGTVSEAPNGNYYYYECALAEVDALGFLTLTPLAPGALEYSYPVEIGAVDLYTAPATDADVAEAILVNPANKLATNAAGEVTSTTAPDNAGIGAARAAAESVNTKLTNIRAQNLDRLDANVSTLAKPGDAMTLSPGERDALRTHLYALDLLLDGAGGWTANTPDGATTVASGTYTINADGSLSLNAA